VRKAIRRGSAEEEVRKHWDRVTGAWKQISKQRRRVDVSYDPGMVTALQHVTWMDEEGFKKTCIKETSSAPTNVAFPPSPTHIFTAFSSAWGVAQIQQGFCHRGATLCQNKGC